jgi:hypothetical protein
MRHDQRSLGTICDLFISSHGDFITVMQFADGVKEVSDFFLLGYVSSLGCLYEGTTIRSYGLQCRSSRTCNNADFDPRGHYCSTVIPEVVVSTGVCASLPCRRLKLPSLGYGL